MTPFVEILTNGRTAPSYVRLDAIVALGHDEWENPIVLTTIGTYPLRGESLEQFKTRLRIAVVPAPREEGE